MPQLNFAVFESRAAAEPVVKELSTRTAAHPNFAVQTFDRAPLDGSVLPESGTEVGRNTALAIGIGAGVGLAIGVGAGLTGKVIGMGPGMGAAIGALFGVVVGALSGMMAGTREAKAQLRAIAEAMAPDAVLLTVETDDTVHAELVQELLTQAGGRQAGSC